MSLSQDGEEVTRKPGDRWLIRGPLEYVPPVEVEVLERRRSIPLAENEGIYVRDIKTGKVSRASSKAVVGIAATPKGSRYAMRSQHTH